MTKRNITLSAAGLILLAILLYQIPAINDRLSWRFEVARTYVRNVLNPVGNVPTAIPQPTKIFTPTKVIYSTATTKVVTTVIPPTPTLAPPPAQASIASPPYEKQTANNCGPAALSMMLHVFGWSGNRKKDISGA
ncbi:MAG: hypothetical protein U0X87_11830 [Anaerolineales bacterium]